MEFLLFAIVGIIVAVISAATKQKPKQKQDDEQQQQQQAPRRTVSDIQRAFTMLLDDFDNNAQSDQQQAYNYGKPQPSPQEHTSYAEGDSGWEGEQKRPAPVRKKPAAPTSAVTNKYTNVKLSHYFMDEPEEDQQHKVIKKTAGGFGLHFGTDELVRAVIYSEILARRKR